MPASRPLVIVPHTHWDREWYRTFEQYRYRLVATIDRVLDANLPHFLLDGQTAVVDDYLALRPERLPALVARLQAGELTLGPWYVLVDEFLVSGEALIRNLLAGRATMQALGVPAGSGTVGYLPDMFGHIAQMPQVLAGFGLQRAVVWRGARPAAPAFWWTAPDGTRVRTAWLPQGYYQTILVEDLGDDDRRQRLESYLASFDGQPAAWLLAGGDHLAPRADTAALVERLAAAPPDGWAPRIAGLDALFEGPVPEAELEGELREAVGMAYLLPGVLSTRTYLKQTNARIQSTLERCAEPLAALAWWGGARSARITAGLRHAWRTLMLNHPHDSICGCSIDAVHREMLPRFEAAAQVAEEVLAEAVRVTARPTGTPEAFVFNGAGHPVADPVVLTFDWAHTEDAPAPLAIRIVDADGTELPLHRVSVEDAPVFAAEPDLLPDWYPARRFRVVTSLTVPALGGRRIRALPADTWPDGSPAEGLTHDAAGIENEALRVEVVDGRVDLIDKVTGRRYEDVHGFVDEADAGDSYNFSPVEGDTPIAARLVWHRIEGERPWERVLEVTHHLLAPVALEPDRTARAREAVQVEIISRFRLTAGGRAVAVETRLDHALCDHRLRLRVRGVSGDGRAYVDGTFGVFERRPVTPSPLPAARGTEATMPEHPQGAFTALEEPDGSGLAVLGEGLHEVTLLNDAAGAGLDVTLLRAVGWLSRDDLRTRGGGAGPRFPTPEAQCPGPQLFRHGLSPLRAGWVDALAPASAFAAPLRAWQGAGPACPSPALSSDLPTLVWSALKPSEDGRHLVLRAFNAANHAATGTVGIGLAPARVAEATLAETPTRELEGPGPWAVAFRPYEIRTWLLTP